MIEKPRSLHGVDERIEATMAVIDQFRVTAITMKAPRCFSLAITKLEEAQLWFRKGLDEEGSEHG